MKPCCRRVLPTLAALPLALACVQVLAADAPGAYLDLRYRYEQVDQAGFDRDAVANTLRVRAGWRSTAWHGWSALAEADAVLALGGSHNDTRNGQRDRPVIADPAGAEINQVLLRHAGTRHAASFGRQRINLGNQRFVGGVGWRQNEQTYDGVRLQASPWKPLQLDYAWIGGINTVFGPGDGEASTPANRSDIDGDSHLLQATWTPLPALGFLRGQMI